MSSEKGLPTEWSSTTNIAWKTEIPGEGWSSPVIYGDRVFVTTAVDTGVSCRVLCLKRQTGEILWNKEVVQQTPKRKEKRNSYATPTPVTVASMFMSHLVMAASQRFP
jgi:outer membrane protein assembly factor BamB